MSLVEIYLATNKNTGKQYVGLTSAGLKERRSKHVQNAKAGRIGRFYDAIRKHGPDAFDWSVLSTLKSFDEAKKAEINFIRLLSPVYNVTAGGDGVLGGKPSNRRPVICLNDGKIFPCASDATKHYGLYLFAASFSARENGEVGGLDFDWHYGMPMSENDRKARIIERQTLRVERRKRGNRQPLGRQPNRIYDREGRLANGPMKNARRVICLDDGESYESASAAADSYGVCKSALIELCRGQRGRLSVGGRRFAYEATNELR